MTEKALVLVNLGSTPSTNIADVRRYLNQFLMDRYVIDVPWPLRRFIVSTILAKRPKETAAAYQSIWWDKGSPLTVLSKRLELWSLLVYEAGRQTQKWRTLLNRSLPRSRTPQGVRHEHPVYAESCITTNTVVH